jgi:AmiR/NasT family two-component response regulator
MTKRVLSLSADLLFASNIEATLGRGGYAVVTVETLSELQRAVDEQTPDVVVLDLHAGVEAADVVSASAPAPVVAFGRHTEPALLRAAREAGCVVSVPRSTFVEEMTTLVEQASRTTAGD